MVARYLHENTRPTEPGFKGFYFEVYSDSSVMLMACRGPDEDDCVTRYAKADHEKVYAIDAAVERSDFAARPPRALPAPKRYGEARAGWVWGVGNDGLKLPPFVSPADAARMKPIYDAIRAAVPIRDFRRVNRDADKLLKRK
ncbi:hypothetical protein [Vannielia litorea]|uniref:hypothetical protein n=1 Tax=Vannielia litorea TaxID=1217970 RepID=UPI001BD053EE|nr:hypothetical protein [Vannielia litorea]